MCSLLSELHFLFLSNHPFTIIHTLTLLKRRGPPADLGRVLTSTCTNPLKGFTSSCSGSGSGETSVSSLQQAIRMHEHPVRKRSGSSVPVSSVALGPQSAESVALRQGLLVLRRLNYSLKGSKALWVIPQWDCWPSSQPLS